MSLATPEEFVEHAEERVLVQIGDPGIGGRLGYPHFRIGSIPESGKVSEQNRFTFNCGSPD
jgi:hypothetical protein